MLLTQAKTAHHGETPGVPSSTVHVLGTTQLRYCVTSYAPSHPVKVAEAGGASATIHTSNVGSGCTVIAYDVVCGNAGHAVVATGIGADGNPATSSATLTASVGTPTCTPSATAHSGGGGGGGGGGGMSGGALGVLVGVLAVVILGGIAIAVLLRRRGHDSPAQ